MPVGLKGLVARLFPVGPSAVVLSCRGASHAGAGETVVPAPGLELRALVI